MYSLLGQFYSRIRGSQENIASEGLVYILSRSKAARDTIGKIIEEPRRRAARYRIGIIPYSPQAAGNLPNDPSLFPSP